MSHGVSIDVQLLERMLRTSEGHCTSLAGGSHTRGMLHLTNNASQIGVREIPSLTSLVLNFMYYFEGYFLLFSVRSLRIYVTPEIQDDSQSIIH